MLCLPSSRGSVMCKSLENMNTWFNSAICFRRSRYSWQAFVKYLVSKGSFSSPYSFKNSPNYLFPPYLSIRFYKSDILSISNDLTNDTWTPKPRCVPAQLRQINMPLLTDIHYGCSSLHSKHLLFLSSSPRSTYFRWFTKYWWSLPLINND